MAEIIRASGASLRVTAPTFEEARVLVGGYLEAVRTTFGGRILLVDEDGLRKGLAPNERASFLAFRLIVGDAILLETDEEVRETLGVSR